ncbi:uncharacterized protein N7511_011263 [Penicillium nucicola]|uniref:uncharacterized protein n=1 Tax=Penicillium nucicola TaxID=1850975 RepID=UPI0025451366|nr:uncharacterized protein N7511_011263 [Penicillium nucicola]KAJ5742531.1 hypothetical protein N7511_011263 [Penicillium nucicola]
MPPRELERDHQHTFPVLKRIACNILSVLAGGAGVERLFNSAQYELAFNRKYAIEDEIELQEEEVNERTRDEMIEISDDDQGPSQQSFKRQRSDLSDNDTEQELDDKPKLPEQSTQRASGRVRKGSRL